MGRSKRIIACLAAVALLAPLHAHADDMGLIVSAGVDKKVNNQLTVGGEAELRTRNDCRTIDRFSVDLGARYKITRWLKADARYQLIVDNRPEKLTLNEDESYHHWRPSYYALRHRVSASITADVDWGRFNFALRERYQYTYRPEATTTRYDFDKEAMEDCIVRSKSKHVLRSRLKVEYNIPHCKFTPWVAGEIYTTSSLEKTKLSIGGSYTIKKRHTLDVGYMYQLYNHTVNPDDVNIHQITMGYNFKF